MEFRLQAEGGRVDQRNVTFGAAQQQVADKQNTSIQSNKPIFRFNSS
jgi:hypothetical protein